MVTPYDSCGAVSGHRAEDRVRNPGHIAGARSGDTVFLSRLSVGYPLDAFLD
jgi:hypothetical protein